MNAISMRPLHAEQTGDPAVLRWVVHHDGLKASESAARHPDDGPLGRLVDDGMIRSVAVERGDIVIGVDDAATWREIADKVRGALVAELDRLDTHEATWLVEAVGPTTCVRREDLQAIIDRAAGPLLRLHGGTVTVTDVAPDRVTIAMSGACSGCGGVTSTVQGVIAPAVHAGYPELEVIVAPEAPTPAPRVIDVKKPGGLLGRGRGGGSCH